MDKETVSWDLVDEQLKYENGELFWKVARPGVKKGSIAGCINQRGYRVIRLNYQRYYNHRLIWFLVHKEWPPEYIDHIDGDTSNNNLSNLRLASPQQNAANKKKGCGYQLDLRTGKYQARIGHCNRIIPLGTFNNKEDALAAYRSASLELHREFSRFSNNNNDGEATYGNNYKRESR